MGTFRSHDASDHKVITMSSPGKRSFVPSVTRPVSDTSLPTGQDSEPGPSQVGAAESGHKSDGEEMEEDQEADEEEVGDISID